MFTNEFLNWMNDVELLAFSSNAVRFGVEDYVLPYINYWHALYEEDLTPMEAWSAVLGMETSKMQSSTIFSIN